MSIPAGIFLLTLGAILAWAVSDRFSGVDLTAMGYILMAAGALGMVLTLILSNRRREVEHHEVDPEVEDQYRVHDTTVDETYDTTPEIARYDRKHGITHVIHHEDQQHHG
ncbi:MAG TPA: DUF6458 family protein [Kribbellaceae bacterium]